MNNDQDLATESTTATEAPPAETAVDDQGAVIAELESRLAERDSKVTELEEQVKRVSAEFQNFSRRQEEELKRRAHRLKEDVFRSLLPVLDNLERALDASKAQGTADALIKGVELVDRDMRKILEEHGVAVLEANGQPFDPAFHEAVMTEEREDVPDQTVLQELQKGYLMEGKVLRPSLVKVSRS